MRQVEERDAFRGAFSEATGKLKDTAALKTVATRLLGVYLRSSRVVYGNTLDNGLVGVEPGYVDGVMPIQRATWSRKPIRNGGSGLLENETEPPSS